MALVPLERHTDRKRSTNEHEKGKLKREKERADWNDRNNKKWKR